MRLSGDVLTDVLGSGQASDYYQPITASSGQVFTDNSTLPSASGSDILSGISDTVVNALKAVAGYNLTKDQLEVQKIQAQRGMYGSAPQSAAQQSAAQRNITQIAGSNIMPMFLIAGVGLAAFMVLRK